MNELYGIESGKCENCGKEKSSPFCDFCDNCIKKSKSKLNIQTFIGFIIILILSAGISFFISTINYNYGLNKCNLMDSGYSNYNFDNKIEINAEYTTKCYYLNNHPLARINYFLLPFILGIIFGSFILAVRYVIILNKLEETSIFF